MNIDFKTRFHIHEHWIELGDFSKSPINGIPAYAPLLNQEGDTYLFARQEIAALVIDSDTSCRLELRDIVERVKNRSLDDYNKLRDHFDDGTHLQSFESGNDNLREAFKFLIPSELTQMWVYYYQLSYELNPLHEFLLILAIYLKESYLDINTHKFRDAKGNYKKGGMLDYLCSAFKNYPDTLKLIRKGYNPKLRNSIGHNNYAIENNKIRNSEVSVEFAELKSMLYSLQLIKNSFLNIMSSMFVSDPLLNCVGAISIKYGMFKDGVVAIQLYKLWCFEFKNTYEVSPIEGFEIEIIEDGRMCSRFIHGVSLCGPIREGQYEEMMRHIKDYGFVIYINYLKPIIGISKEGMKIEVIDGIEYQITSTEQFQYIM